MKIILAALLLFSFLPAVGFAQSATGSTAADTFISSYTSDELLQIWQQLGVLLRINGAYPFSELERGDIGYEVTALQTQLSALGYYQKTIVDNFGNGTYNALREFEKDNGLKVNGVASVQDQQLIYQAAIALTEDAAQTDNELFSAYSPEELLQLWTAIGAELRTDGSYPFEELEKGDIGYDVTMLQTRLKELGYYHKDIVDNFGTGTFNGFRDFERQNELIVDGIASAADQQVLFSSAAASYVQQTTTRTTTTTNQKDATSGATP